LARHVLKGSGALALTALVIALNFVRLPVVTLLPGPVEDVLPQVKVGDATPTYETKGRLFLTTVGVDSDVTFYEALLQLADRDVEVVPRGQIYPEDRSEQEVNLENAAEMDDSKLAATVVGLREAGYKVDTNPDGVRVAGVLDDGAASGKLRADDRVLEVGGNPVHSGDQVRQAITGAGIGHKLTFKLQRGRGTVTETVTTRSAPTRASQPGAPRPYVGVSLANVYDFPVDLQIETTNIGGPSAGLMFALSIIEKLGKEDLTGDRLIAGTGILDFDGNVGEIGGIRQKMIAAKRRGATVFLTPIGNYDEARRVKPDGLEVVPVRTVRDALVYLRRTSPSRAAGSP
jgi:PDZ domain-containing protein